MLRDGQPSAEGRTAEESGTRTRPFNEPSPIWDGENVAHRWKRKRREILLWRDDQPEGIADRLGVCLFRGLVGKAADLAEPIPDSVIRSPDAVDKIIAHFDTLYRGFLDMADDKLFEQALYSGVRLNPEEMITYTSRKIVEFTAYEKNAGATLPTNTRGKILLRQARMSNSQASKVQIWLAGNRDEASVIQMLCRLDTDNEVVVTMTNGPAGKKLYENGETENYLEKLTTAGPNYASQNSSDEPLIAVEDDEKLMAFYEDDNDVGIDSDDENYIWVFPEDVERSFDEKDLMMNLAQFAEVHKAKDDKKLARGFFAPSNYPGGFRGQGKGKGKGKGKFKGKGKHTGRRDERRAKGSMVKVGIAALKDHAGCWTCGQLGHLSAQRPRASESAQSGRASGAPPASSISGSTFKGTYFVSKFVDGEDLMNYLNFNFLTTAGHVGLRIRHGSDQRPLRHEAVPPVRLADLETEWTRLLARGGPPRGRRRRRKRRRPYFGPDADRPGRRPRHPVGGRMPTTSTASAARRPAEGHEGPRLPRRGRSEVGGT